MGENVNGKHSDAPASLSEDQSADGKQRYVKMRVQGSSNQAIVPASEVADFADGEDYIMEDVWMTAAEYEALPEFEGY